MKFSYNLLQKYFKEKLPEPKKLSEILTLRSFEIEAVYEAKGDYILEAALLPNRMTDAAGHYFFAKEIAAVLGAKIKEILPCGEKELKLNSPPRINFQKKGKNLDIKIENKNLCSRYIGVLMRDISVLPSPEWLKTTLFNLGLNSINNLVDAANYIMLLTNQPLHIFDFDKLNNSKFKISSSTAGKQNSKPQLKTQSFKPKIIIRNAKKGEKIITLDNKEYVLDESILVIANEQESCAIAGIKGGKCAEVDFNTKNIVIEAANFDRAAIRSASKNLNLKTDASIRFGAGIHSGLTEFGAGAAVCLIKELSGGKVVEAVDFCVSKSAPKFIKFDFNKAKKILGAEIADKEIKNILGSLGVKFKNISLKQKAVLTEIPAVRRDLENEGDLTEEVGRVYGYEKINPVFPKIETGKGNGRDIEIFTEKVKNFFAGQGFYELYNYSFIENSDLKFLSKNDKNGLIQIQNPINSESEFLRPYLLHNVLKSSSLNFKNLSEFRLFELGKTYKFLENKPVEINHLTGIIASRAASRKELFYRIKGILSLFLETIGIGDMNFIPFSEYLNKTVPSQIFHPSAAAEIKTNNQTLGALGEIKEDVLLEYDIKRGRVFIFEIDFDTLLNEAKKEMEFKPFSKFPAVSRDLSLFVPYNTRVAEIEDVIQSAGGELLIDHDLFDIYEPAFVKTSANKFVSSADTDEKFGGKKSLAFRFIFQSENKTLLDKEVDSAMQKIIKALEENLEWEVRK